MGFPPRRRRVPHREYCGGTLFLTWRLHRGQVPLLPAERALVIRVIGRGEGILGRIIAAVVMDDHVHVLVWLSPTASGRRAAQTWKSVSSHELTRDFGRASPVWQREYFDRWVMDSDRIRSCAQYILGNPERRWPGTVAYQWCLGHVMS